MQTCYNCGKQVDDNARTAVRSSAAMASPRRSRKSRLPI